MIFLITLEGFKLPARAEPHDYICLPCLSPHPDKLLVTDGVYMGAALLLFLHIFYCFIHSPSYASPVARATTILTIPLL